MSDQILQKSKKMVYERCLKFDRYMCRYKAIFGIQMVYIYTEIYGANIICFGVQPEMTDLTGIQLVYGILVYV